MNGPQREQGDAAAAGPAAKRAPMAGARWQPAPDAILEARGIGIDYAGAGGAAVPVVADFSLALGPGEILAILGPSGAGKSSLLRVLAGLQAPRHGAVRVHGQPLAGPHPGVGFVFQTPGLLPWLSLEENVRFGLSFRHQPRLDAAQRNARVQRAIGDVGLLAARQRYPDELSGGMAQRAALARTLARDPGILLLDEPFSALDEATRRELHEHLLWIAGERGTAMVLVTHDIDEALLLADRILLLGGQPASVQHQCLPQQARPRDETHPEFTALRVDLLQHLRSLRKPRVH